MYAEVVVNVPVEGTFHYHIPADLQADIRPGCLVEVPFGSRREQAIVVRLVPESPVTKTKPIARLLEAEPVVGPAHIALAEWMSRATLSSWGECLRLFLPPGLSKKGDIRVTLLEADPAPNTAAQKRVLSLLMRRGGTLRGRQIARALPHARWRRAVSQLAQHGVVQSVPVLDAPSVSPRTVRTARLAIPPEEMPGAARRLGRESKRASVLEVLDALEDPLPPLDAVCEEAGCGESVVRALDELGMVNLFPRAAMVSLAQAKDDLTEKQKEVVAQLRAAGGALPRGAIGASTGILRRMEKAGVILRWEEPARVNLALGPEEVAPALLALRGGTEQHAVLRLLAEAGGAVNVSDIYAQTGAALADLQALAEEGLVVLGEVEVVRDPLEDYDVVLAEAPALTTDQQDVWEVVREVIETPDKPVLLHGVTGSGKTEIYLRAAETVVRAGRQAIVLVPEISLTPQTVRRFAARFSRRLGVVHSRLSTGERYDTWRRARAGELDVIVGARSALFTPLPDVGLIVLDESHDDSYKQSPPITPPYYHAREAAVALGRLCSAAVILGTATPDLVTFHRAQQGDYHLLALPQRVMGHRERIQQQAGRFGIAAPAYRPAEMDAVYMQMPPVQIVDMRQELRIGNRSMFSRALREALAHVLDAGEQAILFLNRRGTATSVMCRDCGEAVMCPHCDTPLVYHGPGRALVCHHCGHRAPQPRTCPACGGERIRYLGVGTELVEQAVAALFPGVRTLRWDRDTTGAAKGAHAAILAHFVEGGADVLVGTQMIAKGLDLPLVTLVGVVLADVGLTLPDYRAPERTFQVLAQVAGRAGRGLLGGRVVLQTYRPDHYAVMAAAHHDYPAFYAEEIAARRALGYPPFRRLARLLFRHPKEQVAQEEAERAAARIRERIRAQGLAAAELIGPAPCFFARLAGRYRWHVLVRSPDPARVLAGLPRGADWIVDMDPVDLL